MKSKGVLINGFEFVAVAQSRWIILNSSSPANGIPEPIDVQLWITNQTAKDKLFSLFDTFSVVIRDASGKVLNFMGGRDHSYLVWPVLIHPGQSYCLSRPAGLAWTNGSRETPGSKTEVFNYDDGTGSFGSVTIPPGKYTLAFAVQSNGVDQPMDFVFSKVQMPGFSWKEHPPLWSGKGETPGVSFEAIAAPRN